MAITFTTAGLQTQLSAVATAIDGADWPSAKAELAKAHLILVGLPAEVRSSDNGVRLRDDLDKLAAIIDSAQASNNMTDRRRLIRTGLQHG